jgi:hypothetical protein
LFYLGESKEEITLLIAEKNVKWTEYIKDNGDCIVTGDEFIFEFNENRELITVAVDYGISPRYSGTTRKPLEINYYYDNINSIDKPYVKTSIFDDDLLYYPGKYYIKITVDMGTHYFFACYRDTNKKVGSEMFRWGIMVKE